MKQIHTEDAPPAVGPYSQGIIMDGWFFSSGQIPLNSNGEKVEGDIGVQTLQVFDNLKAVLAAADLTLNDVVKASVFITDLKDFADLNKVYAAAFGDHKPARSTVEVSGLALGVNVEIEVIARKT